MISLGGGGVSAHTTSLLRAGHETAAQAATHGYGRALLGGAVLGGSAVAVLAPNTRQTAPAVEEEPALDLAA